MSSLAVDLREARAQSVRVSSEALEVDLVDGRTIIVPLVWFPRLWHGTAKERNRFEIRLHRVTTPSSEQKSLLALLGLTLPERLDFDLECRVNSAIR